MKTITAALMLLAAFWAAPAQSAALSPQPPHKPPRSLPGSNAEQPLIIISRSAPPRLSPPPRMPPLRMPPPRMPPDLLMPPPRPPPDLLMLPPRPPPPPPPSPRLSPQR
jgi:hypothetical protein